MHISCPSVLIFCQLCGLIKSELNPQAIYYAWISLFLWFVFFSSGKLINVLGVKLTSVFYSLLVGSGVFCNNKKSYTVNLNFGYYLALYYILISSK